MKLTFYKFILAILLISFFHPAFTQTTSNVQQLNQISLRLAKKQDSLRTKIAGIALEKNWKIYKRYSNGQIISLQGIDENGFPIYYITDNNVDAAATVKTDKLYTGGSLGLSLNGSSIFLKGKVGIWDGGNVLETHQEFTPNRIDNRDGVAVEGHPTHVAGTIMARGAYAPARGMAYGLPNLFVHDFDNDKSEMAKDAANTLLSNHSYGIVAGWYYESNPENGDPGRWEWYGSPGSTEDYKFGYYDSATAEWDKICFNAPYYLPVKSSGNNRNDYGPAIGETYFRFDANGKMVSAGPRLANISSNNLYDVISTYGTAKNILTVGAVEKIENGYTNPLSVKMASFSSWGPSDDGRIKPDIVGMGVAVLSSYSSSNMSYAVLSGTSMAAPSITGSLVLLQEQYYLKNNHKFMRAASLKGLALHTADEAGSNPGPDYRYGWGLLNMEKASLTIKGDGVTSLIAENDLFQGETQTITVIAAGNEPVKATLCWTDPEGKATTGSTINNRTPKLVNDLDLRIKSSAQSFLPWVLDPEVPTNAATKGDNIRDNVEQVIIDNPIAGNEYAVTITSKGTLRNGKQNYSIILSGATTVSNTISEDVNLVVYPIPTEDNVIVKFKTEKTGDVLITVSNILGQKILSDKTTGFIGSYGKAYSLASQPNGIYLFKIDIGGKVEVRKVILNKK